MDPMMLMILVFLMMFMGGGNFPFVTADLEPVNQPVVATEFHCEKVVNWTVPPRVVNGVFFGTAELGCQFAGLSGGGIPELQAHMVSNVPGQAKLVHSGPVQTSYSGMPSTHYELTVQPQDSNVELLGDVNIVSYGALRLRNIFHSKQARGRGASFVKDITSEIDVMKTSEDNWYGVQMTSSPRFQKPPFVSAKDFYYYIKENTEKHLKDKAVNVVHDIANHL